jgi:cytochrome oxidase Cu insertion factor (SCO1/SenC/PrrC family)
MKNVVIAFVCIVLCQVCSAQKDSSVRQDPYLRFPTVPPFTLLKVDSSTRFTKYDLKKKRPVLLILFNPDCEHCQHETEEILKNIDRFHKVEIVMSTTMPFNMMKKFYLKYSLDKYDNIHVGRDYQFFLPSFFMIHNIPYIAMYDKKGNLITTSEGTLPVADILQTLGE